MRAVVVSYWDADHEKLSVVDHGRTVAVLVPRALGPAEAATRAAALDLDDRELERFRSLMAVESVCCRCGGEPDVVMGYSAAHTGQVGSQPYCRACADETVTVLESVTRIRSYGEIPFPR